MAKVKGKAAKTASATVEKADRTRGDDSPAAAGGGSEEINAHYIPFSTPAVEERTRTPTVSAIDGHEFLEPPEDPVKMYEIYQLSALLPPVVDSLETNVYKPGFVLKPTIDLSRPESREELRKAILWEKSRGDFTAMVAVTDDEIDEVIKQLEVRSVIEKQFLDRFFSELVPDMPLRRFMQYTGQDKEVTGNAYWEVIRDTTGKISRLQWVPSTYARATRQAKDQIGCTERVRHSVLSWMDAPQIRRFRRYGQIYNGEVVAWFKEFGDPRVLSRETGKYYPDLEALQEAEGVNKSESDKPLPATEIIHHLVPFGGSSVYGKPNHSGSYPCLVGSRELDEENLKIASDEAIPSMMLLIAGGIVGAKSIDRIQKQIQEREKGRKGIMLIEAQAAGKGPSVPTQQPTMDVVKTKTQQNADALFQKYDTRNEEKVAASQRMPKALMGKDLGQNRATTEAMLRFAEEQIFKPKRDDIDEVFNDTIFADLGITCWRYETKSMQPRDPQILTEIVAKLTEAGLLRPNEGRRLAGEIFNEDLPAIGDLWTRFPPRVLTVLLQTKNQALAGALLSDDPDKFRELIEIAEAGGGQIDDETPPPQPPQEAADGEGGGSNGKPQDAEPPVKGENGNGKASSGRASEPRAEGGN